MSAGRIPEPRAALPPELVRRAEQRSIARAALGWEYPAGGVRVVGRVDTGDWWWLDGDTPRVECGSEEEALRRYLDATDPRLEALRLVTAVRQYLDRAGLIVDHRAERIASEQARALEQLLATMALGTLPELPLEQLLSVAIDRAASQESYSEQLRSQVASVLPGLKLCTPWLDEPGVYERSIRDCATGAQLISISDELADEGEYEHTYFQF